MAGETSIRHDLRTKPSNIECLKTQHCNTYGSPNRSDVNIGKLILIFFKSNANFQKMNVRLSFSKVSTQTSLVL